MVSLISKAEELPNLTSKDIDKQLLLSNLS